MKDDNTEIEGAFNKGVGLDDFLAIVPVRKTSP